MWNNPFRRSALERQVEQCAAKACALLEIFSLPLARCLPEPMAALTVIDRRRVEISYRLACIPDRKSWDCPIPEGRKVFPRMTVRENLLIGAYANANANADTTARLAGVFDTFRQLKERLRQLAGTMSGGEQAMLSIGRGLMAAPKLLIIDDPSIGLSRLFVNDNFVVIRRINETGVTIVLLEQNVKQTLAIAHHGYVLTQGKVVAAGDAAALR